ncbi:lysin B [Mycobacterium phage Trouble]|uniref:lysin B n=1 Tax=Mycobacterium phage Trouble TaxID=1340825 RepID=UPI000387ED0D|nr:lysin B [Mycobacterium phage Trouble]AGT12524.1 lysin B [Mycobacterium phage Trouble]QGJ90712.1 lysin B [Mycobacterium phage Sagefire]QXN72886.1 lysin B [Mycobacterium Phage Sunshine924]WNM72134.1 lysin B [Mycobacterium phage Ashballer]
MPLKLGDRNPTVRRWREVMAARFAGYARIHGPLPTDTDEFGPRAEAWQTEYESRTFQPLDGIVSDDDLRALGIPAPEDTRPVLLTVSGTGVPWWVGPDADVARRLGDVYLWRPVGPPYTAQAFPMGPSVANGVTEATRILEEERQRIERYGLSMIGYSQGAIVTSELWEYHIKPVTGRLHWVKDHVRGAVTFGNPMRETGKVWPDPGGQMPSAKSHGIADQLMVDTPDWWRNYAHKGDLYTDCEGDSGEMKTAIYKVVMMSRVFSGPDSILRQLLEIGVNPTFELIALIRAVLDAGLFFIRGTTPHTNYNIDPATDFLRSVT